MTAGLGRKAGVFFAKERRICVFHPEILDSVIRAGDGYKEQCIILVGIQPVVIPAVCCAAFDMQLPLCQ